MQLTYRGISYESQFSTVERIDAGISAKYRGSTYPVHCLQYAKVPNSLSVLKYRGVSYIKLPR